MANKNENADTAQSATAEAAPTMTIADMLAQAQAFQAQQAAFAAATTAARTELQTAIAECDKEKAAIDGPHKEYLASLDGLIADAKAEYKAKVDGILARRNEFDGQLKQLVAAGVGATVVAKPTTSTASANVAGVAIRNAGVKEFVFGLLEADPALSPADLATACANHYGNDSTTAGTCNGLKVAFKKLNAHLYK